MQNRSEHGATTIRPQGRVRRRALLLAAAFVASCTFVLFPSGIAHAEIRPSGDAVVMEDGDPGTSHTGVWKAKDGNLQHGSRASYGRRSGAYTFAPELQKSGEYEVYMWWPKAKNLRRRVPVIVETTVGDEVLVLNQRRRGGSWNLLGTFQLDGSSRVHVEAGGRRRRTCADAVAFEPVNNQLDPIPEDPPTKPPGPPTDPFDKPPAAPAGVSASASRDRVILDWDDNSEPDFKTYSVYRASDLSAPFDLLTNEITKSDLLDTDVGNGITYYYLVTAMDQAGNESYTSEAVEATPIDLQPSPPTDVAVVAGDGMVTLNWTSNTEDDLAGYAVYSATDPNEYFLLLVDGLTESSLIHDKLTNGTTYYYLVVAFDHAGQDSNTSAMASATPVTDVPPETPEGIEATASDGAVTLTWPGSSEEDFSSYDLFRAIASGDFELHAKGLTTSVFTDNNVANGTEYRYYIVAIDATGNTSAPSSTVAATPMTPTPISRTATLTWTMPTENENGMDFVDLEGFTVHWGTSSDNYSQHINVGKATEYTIELPGPGTYFFSLSTRANSGLESRRSEPVSKKFDE